ncbi:putative ribosome-binding factor A, mitochondrial [Talpa occidentalis]|uniref:putative ribosome-binding factor A, mitochondrial n=1 Tax=Talpa occidentalis TaxID=50954 RepID=UPI00188F96FC|nr:putative ribosome-binding factor A, mitochondrial [Talpa occidentalis]
MPAHPLAWLAAPKAGLGRVPRPHRRLLGEPAPGTPGEGAPGRAAPALRVARTHVARLRHAARAYAAHVAPHASPAPLPRPCGRRPARSGGPARGSAGLGGRHAGPLPARARGLRASPAAGARSPLGKFAARTKKKFWYEGPSLGAHLTPAPPPLSALPQGSPRKTRRGDHVRLRALNGLLHKALAELLCTPGVNPQLCDGDVVLSKVSLAADFSACRVYWRSARPAEHHASTGAALQRSAPQLRHLLASLQILRNVPPIVFMQDKGDAAQAQVDLLLRAADFGPPGGKEDPLQDLRDTKGPRPREARGSPAHTGLCGLDHELLSQQVAAYKRKKESRARRVPEPVAATEGDDPSASRR